MTTVTILSERHPLLCGNSKLDWIKSGAEWRKAWDEATTFDEKLWLLKIGLPLNGGPKVERVNFFFQVADGHYHVDNFKCPEDDAKREYDGMITALGYMRSFAEMRRRLAEEALLQLATFFFGREKEGESRHYWWHLVESKEIRKTLLWFLRINEKGEIPNLKSGAETEDAVKMIRSQLGEIVSSLWERSLPKGQQFRRDAETFSDCVEARPQMIWILNALGRMRVLLDERKYPLSTAARDTLHKVALSKQLDLPDPENLSHRHFRFPKDLDEAFYAGSEAAIVYRILEERQKHAPHGWRGG